MVNQDLYPEIEPFKVDKINCDHHQLYFELSGNPDGPSALFLHGGPGGGTSPRVRRFFDPSHYRIVLLDQRGSGKSVPNVSEDYQAALRKNTTGHLVADIESLRKALQVDQWDLILGGSWGSTLALAYAQANPKYVRKLLLRGIFTFLPDEVDALFQNGLAATHYPEEWDAYVDHIRTTSKDWSCEKDNLIGAYRNRLLDPSRRTEAAKAFVRYELSLSHLYQNHQRINAILNSPELLVPIASLEVEYMIHAGFMRRGELLDGLEALKNHRIHLVQGRNDSVCLPRAAFRLFKALKNSGASDNVTLEYIEGAGHSDSEPPIARALRAATDALKHDS